MDRLKQIVEHEEFKRVFSNYNLERYTKEFLNFKDLYYHSYGEYDVYDFHKLFYDFFVVFRNEELIYIDIFEENGQYYYVNYENNKLYVVCADRVDAVLRIFGEQDEIIYLY